jgi:hypothetical protein
MAKSWDEAYHKYSARLQDGDIDADFIRTIYGPLGGNSEKGNSFADRVIAIHEELEAQRQKFKIPYSGGKIGKADSVWDTAFRLAETGTDSLYDLGQRTKDVTDVDPESGQAYTRQETEMYHKPTGAAVQPPSMSGYKNNYHLEFQDGIPVAYSTPRPSSWMQFREEVLKPVVSIGSAFIPGVGPWVAAANSAYAASKGDWKSALLSGLAAAVPLAGKFGASAQTASTLNNVRQAASVLNALQSKDLLGLAMSGANMAGVTDIAGYSLKDINQAIGMVKALESEDPAAIIRAGMGYMPKDAGSGPSSKDFTEGYFLPGGEGYYDKDAENAKLTGPGYYDEITGRYIQDPLGGLQNPLGKDSGTRDPSLPWEYNQTSKDVWQDADGNVVDLSYIPSSQQTQTGKEIMDSAGVKPVAGKPVAVKPGAGKPNAPGAPSNPNAAPQNPNAQNQGLDVNALMAILGAGQQAAPMVVSSGQENAADIELMENIFGPTMSAPPAGDLNEQTRELARLLRS